ncbi:ABC transporter ATP-binding protein [Oscillatoria sp. CS-180]|uniref:ABC transporter ATP-binding protein n=1 Tax=Oscillatoria sp. CS-180 TaxID=3021720 RepID=UPI00232E740D|nr:ABC transporter ATP-binding protein [Oscillatoria sp. CS-180]MDB9529803.1 ABC transporter ATP-binding protein [Oscillatoria sp. CS-180]
MARSSSPSQKNRHLRQLGQYLKPHWIQTASGILALLLVNLLGARIPLLIRDGIDDLRTTFSFDQIANYAIVVLVLASVMWVIRMASRILLFGVGRQVEFDLKQRIFEHLLRMEPAYFATNTIGELISRATSDVDNIRRLLGFAILSFANTIFAYAFTVPVMLSLNVRLTVVALMVYPVMLILVMLFSERLRDEQLKVQEATSRLSELIQEDLSGIALIKIYAQENNERLAFADLNSDLLEANLKLSRTRNTLFPLLGGLASISLLLILATGAGTIANGLLSVGDFVAMILYVERLVFPTALLGFTITAYQRGEVSIDRVEAILRSQPKIADASTVQALPDYGVKGQLEARNLSFSYPDSPVPALNQVSFIIYPGETVAIVGPIGSGKSTLANALPRLLDIAPGQIFLDGQDITTLPLADLRRAIAYVPQESFLFSTTINNNIRYGEPLAEFTDIQHAAKLAQIAPEIDNFPRQYETIVGERGITLSGGQRQRSALARALMIEAPVVVLDDALSSVDNQTATNILQNLKTGTQHQTVVFISHQMGVAALSDRIIVMDQGHVAQVGTHTELVQKPGLYQQLWEQHKLEEVLR